MKKILIFIFGLIVLTTLHLIIVLNIKIEILLIVNPFIAFFYATYIYLMTTKWFTS